MIQKNFKYVHAWNKYQKRIWTRAWVAPYTLDGRRLTIIQPPKCSKTYIVTEPFMEPTFDQITPVAGPFHSLHAAMVAYEMIKE